MPPQREEAVLPPPADPAADRPADAGPADGGPPSTPDGSPANPGPPPTAADDLIDPATFGFAPVVIDIGGEGRYPNAINVNPSEVPSLRPGGTIPNRVDAFGEKLPFPDNSVDGIVIESGPINPDVIREIVRVLKPGGSIRLLSPPEFAKEAHESVLKAVGGEMSQRPAVFDYPTGPADMIESVITAPR